MSPFFDSIEHHEAQPSYVSSCGTFEEHSMAGGEGEGGGGGGRGGAGGNGGDGDGGWHIWHEAHLHQIPQ